MPLVAGLTDGIYSQMQFLDCENPQRHRETKKYWPLFLPISYINIASPLSKSHCNSHKILSLSEIAEKFDVQHAVFKLYHYKVKNNPDNNFRYFILRPISDISTDYWATVCSLSFLLRCREMIMSLKCSNIPSIFHSHLRGLGNFSSHLSDGTELTI